MDHTCSSCSVLSHSQTLKQAPQWRPPLPLCTSGACTVLGGEWGRIEADTMAFLPNPSSHPVLHHPSQQIHTDPEAPGDTCTRSARTEAQKPFCFLQQCLIVWHFFQLHSQAVTEAGGKHLPAFASGAGRLEPHISGAVFP